MESDWLQNSEFISLCIECFIITTYVLLFEVAFYHLRLK